MLFSTNQRFRENHKSVSRRRRTRCVKRARKSERRMVVSWSRREGRKKKSIHSLKRRGRARRERASYYREREREREGRRERCYGNFLLRNISANGTTDRERSSGVQCTKRLSSREVVNRGVQQVQKNQFGVTREGSNRIRIYLTGFNL